MHSDFITGSLYGLCIRQYQFLRHKALGRFPRHKYADTILKSMLKGAAFGIMIHGLEFAIVRRPHKPRPQNPQLWAMAKKTYSFYLAGVGIAHRTKNSDLPNHILAGMCLSIVMHTMVVGWQITRNQGPA
jgi:hypothetical protein